MKRNVVVIIPAYNPPSGLVNLAREVIGEGMGQIVVVNDDSNSSFQSTFDLLKEIPGVEYLEHAQNRGKGAALKTGFKHILKHHVGAVGVVTADADGQHTAKDIAKVAERLVGGDQQVVLGVRKFDETVPPRSRLGNNITKKVFAWATGREISDTQTGLRAIATELLPSIAKLPGDRYEYEIRMLMALASQGISIGEEGISTIYVDNNALSHFRPVLDSMRIYFVLLRYVFSSLTAAAVDFLFFTLLIQFIPSVTITILISRYVIGALVNFTINRSLVFYSRKSMPVTLIQYYIVATISGLLASALIILMRDGMGVHILWGKIISETILFPLGFVLQKKWVFAGGRRQSPNSKSRA